MKTIVNGTATVKNAHVWSQAMKFEKSRVLKLVQNQETITSHFLQNTEPKFSQEW